jgi:hypothetical protein
VDERRVAWLTYHRGVSTVDHYHRFELPKRSGGTRLIAAPKPELKAAQRWLLRTILDKIRIHAAAMAFRPGGSIVAHARRHAGKAVVVRVDLQEFFATISWKRVRGVFVSFGYNEGIATVLALLATDPPRVAARLDGRAISIATGSHNLPQGACTSPAITNIICRGLDARLAGLAQRYDFDYSRYADDLVFSSSAPEADLGALLSAVRYIVGDEGFAVNESKTAVMRRHQRQVVTGLVVNQGVRVSRADLRRFRAFLHQCETHGLEAMSGQIGRDARQYAAGYLAYLAMVSPVRAAALRGAHLWLAGDESR